MSLGAAGTYAPLLLRKFNHFVRFVPKCVQHMLHTRITDAAHV